MLQRLGFVCSLIHDPQLVILDEPVSGLDPIGRKEIKDVISEINKEGKTVFFSSHIVPDVEEICHTVVFLERGKLIYQGSIDKLIHEHNRSSFEISYKQPNKIEFNKIVCTAEDRSNVLADLLARGMDIISLNQEKSTLEEIFYKVKSTGRNIHD
jgi:ABC-2 type transport system ATP-binding protein